MPTVPRLIGTQPNGQCPVLVGRQAFRHARYGVSHGIRRAHQTQRLRMRSGQAPPTAEQVATETNSMRSEGADWKSANQALAAWVGVGGQVGLRECLLRSGAAPVCGCGLPTIIHPAGLPRRSSNPQTATAKPMRPAMLAPTPHAPGVLMLIAVGSYPLHRSSTHTSATANAPSRRLRRSSRRTPA